MSWSKCWAKPLRLNQQLSCGRGFAALGLVPVFLAVLTEGPQILTLTRPFGISGRPLEWSVPTPPQ